MATTWSPLAARRATAQFVRRRSSLDTNAWLPVSTRDADTQLPKGLFILPDFICQERHDHLSAAARQWLDRRLVDSSRAMDMGRRCVEFGPPFKLPGIFQKTVVDELFVSSGLVSSEQQHKNQVDYLAINEYKAPGGIEAHVDEYTDSEQILTLSLLEDCVMELSWRGDIRDKRKIKRTKYEPEKNTKPKNGFDSSPLPLRLLLRRRSLLVLRDEARWAWAHGIAFGGVHEFDEETSIPRSHRLSLTFLLHPEGENK